ncbi:hypothetical protein [Paenibacillus spongiae]|uniref:NodB homology domain-containing protein n=1 Tax=Paenibacillus spongiae TaxID=2909671 RepID=A0ABY5SF98_9BACL|nr:hypothetical protein [Paenibacillus spongiae]UVI32664.1 hypothetical protein L1F29_12930 [Paenibacillus spongiae]
MRMAHVGVLLDRKAAERRWQYGLNSFEYYMEEVLRHAGVPFERLEHIELLPERSYDIVIAALAPNDAAAASLLWSYAEQGGTVIACAGLNAMAARLGAVPHRSSGPGYASFVDWRAIPVRYSQAAPWKTEPGNPNLIQETGMLMKDHPAGAAQGPARQTFRIGKGLLERWAIDICGTIVELQQGTGPVLDDGEPAPDGTAAVNEGILKADDRIAMDWEHDRLLTETGSPYFAYPYADYWRDLFIGHLLQSVLSLELTLPVVGCWPDGIERVAMISHDSDLNQDIHAESALEQLGECGIRSTWCMIEPGYSPGIYDLVKAAGHELAFHYNALDEQNGRWAEDEFERQLDWLKQAANLPAVTSNKNHYTRFEGWGELFEWCEKGGVQSDQTRGPSKKGNVGFIFGTCRPYFPIAWAGENNRMYDVLEIGFLTQDLDLTTQWSDSSVINPFLDEVARMNGVAHFLFHQVHIHNSASVRAALRRVVEEARSRGFTFWTGEQINRWERSRRNISLDMAADGTVIVSGEAPEGAVIWIPVPDGYEPSEDEELADQYGVSCRKESASGRVKQA